MAIDKTKAFEIDNGLLFSEGGHISSGSGAPTHSASLGDWYLRNDVGTLYRHDGSAWVRFKAPNVPFDPGSTILTSTDVESAIRELALVTATNTRAYTFASYNGNAGVGKYLEFFPGVGSDTAPFFTPTALKCLLVVSATTAANATCGIDFIDLVGPTTLHTHSHSAQKRVTDIGSYASPLFTIPANAQLAIKVASGSILTPHLYFAITG